MRWSGYLAVLKTAMVLTLMFCLRDLVPGSMKHSVRFWISVAAMHRDNLGVVYPVANAARYLCVEPESSCKREHRCFRKCPYTSCAHAKLHK